MLSVGRRGVVASMAADEVQFGGWRSKYAPCYGKCHERRRAPWRCANQRGGDRVLERNVHETPWLLIRRGWQKSVTRNRIALTPPESHLQTSPSQDSGQLVVDDGRQNTLMRNTPRRRLFPLPAERQSAHFESLCSWKEATLSPGQWPSRFNVADVSRRASMVANTLSSGKMRTEGGCTANHVGGKRKP